MENLPKPAGNKIPFRDEDGVVRMYDIPDWWKGGTKDVEETASMVKKGKVEVLCQTPGGHNVYRVFYGKKNNLKRAANYSSAMGAGQYKCYADKSGNDYIPTVLLIGAEHGGEFEGTVAINNLISNIETGKDFAGNENPELMKALEGVNLILMPCVNMDGRARIKLRTMAGQDYNGFRYYSQGTWKDGTPCEHPQCKMVHPIKDSSDFLGGYFNDDGVNIVHDNFFFPMAKETTAILKTVDEFVPDITLHLHGGGNAHQQFYQFDYMPAIVKDKIRELQHMVKTETEKDEKIGEHFYEAEVKGAEDRPVPPSFNIQSACTALCGEPNIVYESNQTLCFEKGRRCWDVCYPMDEVYKHHRILFEATFKYVKK